MLLLRTLSRAPVAFARPLSRIPIASPQTLLFRPQPLICCRWLSSSPHNDERRLDLDKEPRTRAEFVHRYGGTTEWDAAAGRKFVDFRFDTDGKAYTLSEFKDYYSSGSSGPAAA